MRAGRLRALAAAGTLVALAASGVAVWVAWPLPPGLTARPAALSLTIEDRHGLVLRTTRAADGSRASWVPLAEFDPQLVQAFIALEDRRFFAHRGVDPRAVARALAQDLRSRRLVSGASTITMQLARVLRGGGHGVLEKIGQTLWAVRLERHLGKREILEQYLNRVPLGQGTVGVASAAALYFGASPTRLSLGQAALLAGVARAPSADNPFAGPDRARARRATALRRLIAAGAATADAAERAADEPLVGTPGRSPFLAPHFTTRVLEAAEDSARPLSGVWRTSLDLPLQTQVEGEVRHTVDLLRDREVRQAAAVVLDNATGEVLAWVGSPDFWADSAGQVDLVVAPRQPGSALKPFLYGLALDRGVTAATVLADVPRTYQTASGPYQPRNYDRLFHGPVRVREALASSFNVPAVALTDRIGVASLLHVLQAAGFRTLDRGADHYGLGLALGNGDVRLLDLANAYRGLAAGGVWRPTRWDAVPPEARADSGAGARFLSRGAAVLVLDVLSDPVARVPGFGIDTPFDFPWPVAVKTGTSHHFTDNWAVGVTGGFTVAVWVGNFTGRPMRQVSGVTGAGPLLHRVLLDVARRYQPGTLPSPAEVGAKRLPVCRLSGRRPGARCPTTDEWFLPGTDPGGPCDWHDQFGVVTWPAEYWQWLDRTGLGGTHVVAERPSAPAEAAVDGGAGRFRIVSPLEGDRYAVPPGVDSRYATIPLRAAGDGRDPPVRWFVDGRAEASGRLRLQPGTHVVRAVSAAGRVAEVHIEVAGSDGTLP